MMQTPPSPTPQKPKRSNSKAAFMAIGTGLLGLMLVGALLVGAFMWLVSAQKKFKWKARTAEAKSSLAMVYAGEKAHIQEWGSATTDLLKVGFAPDHKARYKIGFSESPEIAPHCSDCVVDGVKFKVAAVGNIDEDPDVDVWTIDQDRKLVHVVDDLKD